MNGEEEEELRPPLPRVEEESDNGRAEVEQGDDSHSDNSDNSAALDLPDPWANPPKPPANVVVSMDALPSIMGQRDEGRMKLTLNEWELAWNIKGMLATDPELEMISDYTIAQLALVCGKARVPEEDALRRLQGLQTFRQEYDIRDTEQEGCRVLKEVVRDLFPGYYMYFNFQPDQGTYILAMDHVKFDTSSIASSPTKFTKAMSGFYYFIQALYPDLESLRKGHMIVVDCGEIGWSTKNDFKVLKQFFTQLISFAPFQTRTVWQYNTGVIFNLLWSMARKVLPASIRDQIRSDCTSDAPLRDALLIPNEEAATQRVISMLQDSLQRRYENERSFSLH